jgi:hypothetical protein
MLRSLDPEEDRLRIRALRASRSGNPERRGVFSAALGQFDELLTAASSVGPASRPLPLYYALNQAGRAIAAARQMTDRPWRPMRHGLTIGDPGAFLGETKISLEKKSSAKPDSFRMLAESINAPCLTGPTMLWNVWAAIPGLDEPGLGAGCPRALRVEIDDDSPSAMFGILRRLQGLPATDGGKTRLARHLEQTYPAVADGLVIESLAKEWPPFDGAKAQLAWYSPDGVRRDVRSVTARYLNPACGYWVIPAVNKNRDVLSPMMLWWCLLLAFSSIARYHSEEWLAALDPDESGVATSIERTLSLALAVVPRLVLLALSPGSYET